MSLDTWLILAILIVDTLGFIIARFEFWKEFEFDKNMFERKSNRIRKTKDKVRVVVEDGKANITEKPEDVNVTIEHRD